MKTNKPGYLRDKRLYPGFFNFVLQHIPLQF